MTFDTKLTIEKLTDCNICMKGVRLDCRNKIKNKC